MGPEQWNRRYAGSELLWTGKPNRFLVAEAGDLPPGRALDLACGEGRNALWLAARGWQVSAVDFSAVALDKARALESRQSSPPVEWMHADATTYRPDEPVDLALLCYLHLVAADRRRAGACAATSLAPGGVLLVIGHDTTNIEHVTGGPQDPRVLFTAADIVADLDGSGAG